MYYSNIPRRKIYEEMLDFEEALMELEILQYNEKNYEKFKENYNKQTMHKLKQTYHNIKSLTIMFLENRKYANEEDFKKDLIELNKNQTKSTHQILKNKFIKIKHKYLIIKLNQTLKKHDSIKDLKHAKKMYKTMCQFNDLIPQFLEIRRDKLVKVKNI